MDLGLMGKLKRWEELEKEYKVYTESVIIYFCIISEMAKLIQNTDYILRGIETNINRFHKEKKLEAYRTPDILYISKDEKNAIIIEIVASFSENYGMDQIKELAYYSENYGINEPFQRQYLIFVLPKKDYSIFLDFRDKYPFKNTKEAQVFSQAFGILLWEYDKENDSYVFSHEPETLPEEISNIFDHLKVIDAIKHGSFSLWPLFLRNSNLPYTCERIYYLLSSPGKFRLGAYKMDEFVFTLKALHKEFKKQIESDAIGVLPPPSPKKRHLRYCLEIFIFAGQVRFKDPVTKRIKDDTILVSSFLMLYRPFERSLQRSLMPQVYCRLAANWEKYIEKEKRKTKEKQSPLIKYFPKNLD